MSTDDLGDALKKAAEDSGYEVLTGDKAHEFIKSIMPSDSELEKGSIETRKKYFELIKDCPYQWDEEWGEISGFKANGLATEGYEWCCRFMFLKGLEWIDQNPNARPKLIKLERVYGIQGDVNIDAEELHKHLRWAGEQMGGDSTGAQHYAITGHLMYIINNGFSKWKEEKIKHEKESERD